MERKAGKRGLGTTVSLNRVGDFVCASQDRKKKKIRILNVPWNLGSLQNLL